MKTSYSPSAMWAAALFALLLLALTGCPKEQPVAKPAAPMGAGDKATAANAAAGSAQAGLDSATDQRLGKIAADSDVAQQALQDGRTADAQGAIEVQQGHLEGVPRDAAEAAALKESETKRAAGDDAGADNIVAQLRKAAQADAVRINKLEQERDDAVKTRDAALDAFRIEAATNMERQQKAIDAAMALAKDGVLKDQVAWLNRIGFACMAITIGSLGLGLAIGGLAALRRVGPLALIAGLGALLCFGAAQIVGAWWFIWAVAGAIAIIVAWAAIWFYRHQKKGDLTAELATRSAKVAAVAEKAVPVLDAAYEAAEKPMKDWLDAHIFDRLSSIMDKPDKETVKQIRATVPEVVIT